MLLSCRSWLKSQIFLCCNLNHKTTIFILWTLTALIKKGKKTLCAHWHYLAHVIIHHSWHFCNTQCWKSHASNHVEEVTVWHTFAFINTPYTHCSDNTLPTYWMGDWRGWKQINGLRRLLFLKLKGRFQIYTVYIYCCFRCGNDLVFLRSH